MKVGDKVVCVKNTRSGDLVVGDVYTIEQTRICKCGAVVFHVGIVWKPGTFCAICKCSLNDGPEYLIDSSRFRPIDYSFGQSVAEEIEKELKVEKKPILA